MSILESIADELARNALVLEEELADENVVEQIAKHIGTSSPTVEEAFRTAIRMRRAEASAKRLMARLGEKRAARPANLPVRRDAT
jgi:protein-disulfide isomerase-like protein with CxxC motif